MFEYPGEKLKILAKVEYVLAMIASVILAFVYGKTVVRYETVFDLGEFLTILGVGSSVSYISALVLYAFGQLIETNEKNANNTADLLAALKNITTSTDSSPNVYTPHCWYCSHCNSRNSANTSVCTNCGKSID